MAFSFSSSLLPKRCLLEARWRLLSSRPRRPLCGLLTLEYLESRTVPSSVLHGVDVLAGVPAPEAPEAAHGKELTATSAPNHVVVFPARTEEVPAVEQPLTSAVLLPDAPALELLGEPPGEIPHYPLPPPTGPRPSGELTTQRPAATLPVPVGEVTLALVPVPLAGADLAPGLTATSPGSTLPGGAPAATAVSDPALAAATPVPLGVAGPALLGSVSTPGAASPGRAPDLGATLATVPPSSGAALNGGLGVINPMPVTLTRTPGVTLDSGPAAMTPLPGSGTAAPFVPTAAASLLSALAPGPGTLAVPPSSSVAVLGELARTEQGFDVGQAARTLARPVQDGPSDRDQATAGPGARVLPGPAVTQQLLELPRPPVVSGASLSGSSSDEEVTEQIPLQEGERLDVQAEAARQEVLGGPSLPEGEQRVAPPGASALAKSAEVPSEAGQAVSSRADHVATPDALKRASLFAPLLGLAAYLAARRSRRDASAREPGPHLRP